jgi:hypothetical protein
MSITLHIARLFAPPTAELQRTMDASNVPVYRDVSMFACFFTYNFTWVTTVL